ncbi:unknown protein [Cronobacter turicensis z3032]|uniref:Uncharacterized protein n=1 Tax=Cronobacter turicensis (strain DSM 18703 / CCUG 55852 / LMG 23827 / z3032) TaxID=693216 RepID=C9XTM2_CROTZ|nr:unknown protein [Cronobacter turicensis z3032]CCJ88850.1 hypothetical protein BN132_778 [Cronobacter turicensis 564]
MLIVTCVILYSVSLHRFMDWRFKLRFSHYTYSEQPFRESIIQEKVLCH